ncbi:MAG: hypothetical protein HeimC3_30060, partial [Candidatus Heimdallarchaeota archaeon LC_3]
FLFLVGFWSVVIGLFLIFTRFGEVFFGALVRNLDQGIEINGYLAIFLVLVGGGMFLLSLYILFVADNQRKRKIEDRVLEKVSSSEPKGFEEVNPEEVFERPIDHGPIITGSRPEPDLISGHLQLLESEKSKAVGITPKEWNELKKQGYSREEAIEKINLDKQKEINEKINQIEWEKEVKRKMEEEKRKIDEERIKANLPPKKRTPDQTLTPSEWQILKNKGFTREQAIEFKKSGKSVEDVES